MKPNHKCDPARMALLYIRQQFICTTFKFDAYRTLTKTNEKNRKSLPKKKKVRIDYEYKENENSARIYCLSDSC